MSRILTKGSVLMCVVVFTLGCGEEISEDSEVPSLTETLSDILPIAKAQETNWRDGLMSRAKARAGQLGDITLGTPKEIAQAEATLAEINQGIEEKVAELRLPVKQAQAALDALDKPTPRGYYGNQQRRCGADGCGNICETKCRVDEVCRGSWCSCVPDCTDRVCGPDGCGGYCGAGVCEQGATCDKAGQCVSDKVVTSKCKANCRSNVRLYSESISYQSTVGRDRSTQRRNTRYPSFYRDFDDVDSLKAYLAAVSTRSAAHGRELTELASIDSQLASAKQSLADLQTAQKALQSKLMELNQAKNRQQMAIYKARKSAPETVSMLTASRALTLEQIKGNKTDRSEARSNIAAQRKRVNQLKLAKSKSAKRIKSLTAAKTKLDTEFAMMSGELSKWQTQVAATLAAKASLEQAQEAFETAKSAAEAEVQSKIDAAQKRLDKLSLPAFAESIVPVWGGETPTAAASAFVLRVGANSRLKNYIAKLKTVGGHWQSELKSLSAEEAEVFRTKTFGKNGRTWSQWNQLLADQTEFCIALSKSTRRLLGIQRAMSKTRDRIGR
jgi:hypothetical protein